MFLFESGQGAGSTLWIRDMQDPKGKFVQIADDMDYQYMPIEVIDDVIYIFTNYDAPKGRVVKVSAKTPQMANWQDLIPETDNVLVSAQMAAGKMIVTYDKDAANHAYVYSLDGPFQSLRFVKLQRPFPVIIILRAGRGIFSRRVTRAPLPSRARVSAAP